MAKKKKSRMQEAADKLKTVKPDINEGGMSIEQFNEMLKKATETPPITQKELREKIRREKK